MQNKILALDTKNVVLKGDFNFRGIDWKILCAIRSIDNDFIDAILDNMLNQVVKEATRGKNTLDLVFVGDASSVQAISVEENFGRSDHSVVYAEIQCPVPRIAYAKKKVYLYTKGEYDDLNDEIKTVVWSNILNSNNIVTNWSRCRRQYDDPVDKYVPSKMVNIGQRHKTPWTRYRSIAKAKTKCRKAKIEAKKSGLVAFLAAVPPSIKDVRRIRKLTTKYLL